MGRRNEAGLQARTAGPFSSTAGGRSNSDAPCVDLQWLSSAAVKTSFEEPRSQATDLLCFIFALRSSQTHIASVAPWAKGCLPLAANTNHLLTACAML
jgi:hypothetical protein